MNIKFEQKLTLVVIYGIAGPREETVGYTAIMCSSKENMMF